jgi:hypothetical protein
MYKATRERFERLEAVVEKTAATLQEFVAAAGRFTEETGRYATASDARMTRVEETLSVLLDAIARQRRNGIEHT